MGMPAVEKRRWTAREVRDLIAAEPLASPRYELVDGELLVTPSPGLRHQAVVGGLLVALHDYLAHEPVGVCVVSPSDIELESETITQPDVYVAPRGEWKRALTQGFPLFELLLAIEVLSPSSGRHDRVRKRPLYLRHVPEYWIVDLDARVFERWRAGDRRPEIVSDRLTWTPDGASTPFDLDVAAFFARALLDED